MTGGHRRILVVEDDPETAGQLVEQSDNQRLPGGFGRGRRRLVHLRSISPLQYRAWIARGGQSNAKLLIEGFRKAGLPE
jgi:hypothetical protein